jgi:hypothetical protein
MMQTPGTGTTIRTALCAVLVLVATARSDTRYHQYCKKAKGSNGAVKPAAVTYFGGTGVELFTDAAILEDGSVLAVGNACGPDFPAVPGLTVLGGDRPVAGSPFRDAEQKKLDDAYAGMAGFVIRFSPDLMEVRGGFRFGFGAATATASTIAGDGTVYLSGRLSPVFRKEIAGTVKQCRVVTPPEGVKAGGNDLYLARFPAGGSRPAWVVIFEQAERPSAAWERRVGRQAGVHAGLRSPEELALVAYNRLYVMKTDGSALRELAPTGGGVLWAVDPRDGTSYIGGDENTRTGREPWRRPFLRTIDRAGNRTGEIWRWDSRRVGTDAYRLVSDSSVRSLVSLPDGHLVVAGWSDGGNSVFNRQPADLDARADYRTGFIDSLWGAGVGSFSRIMRVDGGDRALRAGTIWCSFSTSRNKPNSLWIDDLAVLEDGRIAVTGRSAWALVETPDAWIRCFPEGTSGAYLAVFSPDLGDLLFSTVLPGVTGRPALAVRGTKVLVAAAAKEPVPLGSSSPGRGLQAGPGGAWDGLLLVAETARNE